ncbi:N-acetylneuraminate lyase [Paenibacillus ginsengarvi]|uniref:N-acetylneuraminate lyase n=2 Tax=Paenibacillus ginsengarvi TaxID=400777 RepID=A0A3B0BV41_9BACL|nr:N-acetylneuraminate lyase [Paenibacillus ginsengarvi]
MLPKTEDLSMTIKQADRFSGIHVAMPACYDAYGNVSPESVRRLTRHLLDAGIRGLYVGGGTGEGILQTEEERERTLEAVLEENGGTATVTVHVGAATTGAAIRLARHAETCGADAVSSIPPFYYAYTEEAVKEYWLSVMESAALPFILYYIPSATGFRMTENMLRDLLRHERLLGIKMTTFDTYELQRFKAIGGEKFLVFNGPDQQYVAGRIMGADAGIGGTYGAMPELFLKLEREYRLGHAAEAQRWQFIVNDIITEIRSIGLFAAVKGILRLRGVDCGEPRRPLPGLRQTDEPAVRRLYETIVRYAKDCEQEVTAL